MGVPFDYDATPERYRLGMQVAIDHGSVSLYDRVAQLFAGSGDRLSCWTWAVPTVCCVARWERPVRGSSGWTPHRFCCPAIRRRLCGPMRPGCRSPTARSTPSRRSTSSITWPTRCPPCGRRAGYCAAVDTCWRRRSRADSPELARYWRRPATPFDAEDAPAVVAGPREHHRARLGCATRDPSRFRRHPGPPARAPGAPRGRGGGGPVAPGAAAGHQAWCAPGCPLTCQQAHPEE